MVSLLLPNWYNPRSCAVHDTKMMRFHWLFFLIATFLVITISGQSTVEKDLTDSGGIFQQKEEKCMENEVCEGETVRRNCEGKDDCRVEGCAEGEELDPNAGECRMISNCEGGSCEETMQKMEESPRSLKKLRTKKGLHIALILKKKKKLMKPFMKPKPPPHHHHHHSTEEESEEEEDPIPEPEDAPDPPAMRFFNDEICVEGEDGTMTGNCVNVTEAPVISGVAGNGTTKGRRKGPKPRKEKPVTPVDPSEANVRKKVIRFLKVLRMRRRLSPLLGRILQRSPRKISPEEKMKK